VGVNNTPNIHYYSTIKKIEITSFVGKWRELEIIILGKISQTYRDKYSLFSVRQKLHPKNKMYMNINGGVLVGRPEEGGKG
jgi:hypothetical protein